jgi:3-phosphoshikimate 1-carboxyvinyltransferase
MPLTDPLTITPRGPLDADVQVPGSKSVSNRAILIAALARGQSTLRGVLSSEDIDVMARSLTQMGASITRDGDRWTIGGVDGQLKVPAHTLDVHASGTAARFLTAVLPLCPGRTVLDGTARMRQRPIADLIDALNLIGADVRTEHDNGCPPVISQGPCTLGGDVEIDASKSSQYVSAVLQVAPYFARPLSLRLRGGVLVSRPYVDLTLDVMRDFGAEAGFRDDGSLYVSHAARYAGRDYRVEPDASSAQYMFLAAAIVGGRVRVSDLPGSSGQADMGVLEVLSKMGCEVERQRDHVTVSAPSAGLRAVDVDMNRMPDAVLGVAVAALFCAGTTTIRNVGNLRIKETDRLAALETELRKLGAKAHAGHDSLTITPPKDVTRLHGAAIDTYDDHRMAMSFALAGLRVPGVLIRDPHCVAKSWPGFFEVLARL